MHQRILILLLASASCLFGQGLSLKNPGYVASLGKATVASSDDLVGLRLWYKADAQSYTDGQDVTTITDSSGNGFNLTCPVGERPVFDAAVPWANGLPGIEALGVRNASVTLNNTNLVDGDKTTVFIVTSNAIDQRLYFGRATDTAADRFQAQLFSGSIYADLPDTGGGRLSVVDAGTGFHTWTFKRDGAVMKIRKDGAEVATRSNASGSYTVDTASVYYMISANDGQGLWFEVRIYNVGKTDGEMSAIEATLKTKWGTP